jgi:lysophospholipase L1-like esterase
VSKKSLPSINVAVNPMAASPKLHRLAQRIGIGLRTLVFGLCTMGLTWIAWVATSHASLLDIGLAVALVAAIALIALPGERLSRIRLRLTLLLLGCILAFFLLELYIRWFDPFPILLRGGRIDLPVHARREFSTSGIAGLDPIVKVTFNSRGFRGPEPPTNWDDYWTVLCVGGSTTQCIYLSDGNTWPDLLGQNLSSEFERCWINNAGIDGHSTFGHLELFGQYIAAMRPKVLLLYVGLNDVDRKDLTSYDASTLRSRSRDDDPVTRRIQRFLISNSDTLALFDNLRLQWMARRKGLTHGDPIAHQGLTRQPKSNLMTDEQRRAWLASRDPKCLEGYRQRLTMIVDRCKQHKIACVLMTQQVLYGQGIDTLTGVNLESVQVGEVDGWTQWQLLQKYNAITVLVAQQSDVPYIDVASIMPKSSEYFYDLTHFNNAGAIKMASIIAPKLAEILRRQ